MKKKEKIFLYKDFYSFSLSNYLKLKFKEFSETLIDFND